MNTKRHLILLIAMALISTARAQAPRGEGTVLSTIDAGSYTYVEIDINSERMWFAAPTLSLKAGDRVVAPAGMAMKDFHSETLDRTFEMVYFVDAITSADALEPVKAMPAGHPPIESATCPVPNSACFDFSGIEKPEGAKTVAEIYEESSALTGKSVVVRGIAVKVNENIMGKNWIHLQDGTGKPGSDNLTVTTTNTVEVGSTVTAGGILAVDRDFGYGYQYAVLLEDAVVQ
jgi:hypothetical protein